MEKLVSNLLEEINEQRNSIMTILSKHEDSSSLEADGSLSDEESQLDEDSEDFDDAEGSIGTND